MQDFGNPHAHTYARPCMLKGLLTRDPEKRLGCGEDGPAAIKRHAFFKHIDWAKLDRREIESTYKPKVRWQREPGAQRLQAWEDIYSSYWRGPPVDRQSGLTSQTVSVADEPTPFWPNIRFAILAPRK